MINNIESLLPHRAPMLWIDELTECTDTTACAVAWFGPGHFAVANGKVLESALVECVAQTVAAAQGKRATAAKQASDSGVQGSITKDSGVQVSQLFQKAVGGMLVAVSNFKIHAQPVAGKTLQIQVRHLKQFGPMLQIEGKIICEGETIASGELTVYE